MDPVINAVRRAAWIDCLLFLLLAMPIVSVELLTILFQFSQNHLNPVLGDVRLPDLSQPLLQLSINLFGLFGLVFAVCRLRFSGDLIVFTAVVKLLACVLFGLALAQGLPWVLAIFLLVDLITGLQHIYLSRN